MFWGKRFFKRQYFVAISLFDHIDLASIAKIDFYIRNVHPTYAIKCDGNGDNRQLGWAFVSEHASATAHWNELMRNKGVSFAMWHDGSWVYWQRDREAPVPQPLQDVQLCAVFEAHTKYHREAANEVWEKVLSGYPAHVEWYDASPDKKWTKIFRPKTKA